MENFIYFKLSEIQTPLEVVIYIFHRFLLSTFAGPCIIIQFNQQDATFLQVYYLTFMCGSTCFGRLPAHHQEHTTALGASGFTVGRK